ncbi:MAG TPA: YkgJ family cysteine cluster protein [Phycisphaerae bacterium]|nr:YkgJ family cysteine cluster protein [Phycisphaerae bacterium]HNU45299.1 YkgJ family cysteine cluster protein [Phycisphaerae bacterium]
MSRKQKWYQDGLHFTCTQCGHCCSGAPGYVWVTKEEIVRIARFLERDDDRLAEHQVRRVGLHFSLTERANGDCVFLTRSNGATGCAIYPVRPLQCRTWPFWSQNLAARTAWDSAAAGCPGMNCGKFYSVGLIEAIRTTRRTEELPVTP